MRFAYSEVFKGKEFSSLEEILMDPERSFDFDSTKIKKIRYSINLMLQCGTYIKEPSNGIGPIEVMNSYVSLMQLFSETEELDMFDTETI